MLFDQLHDLGAALPESARPSPNAVSNILAGLVHYVETGSLVPPEPEAVPSPAEQAAASAENTRVAQLEDEVRRLQQQADARQAGPSPVLPSPVTPAEPPAAPAVDQQPSSTAPSESTGGSSPEAGQPAPAGSPEPEWPAQPPTAAPGA